MEGRLSKAFRPGDLMKDNYDEYLHTRVRKTPEQIRAGRREAAIGWAVLVSFTGAVLGLASVLLD